MITRRLDQLRHHAAEFVSIHPDDDNHQAQAARSDGIRAEIRHLTSAFQQLEETTARRIDAELPGHSVPGGPHSPAWTTATDAARALELANRPLLSPWEAAELERLLEANQGNPLFADIFVGELGIPGLIALSNRIGLSTPLQPGRRANTRGLLADTLATALRTPPHLHGLPPTHPSFQHWTHTTEQGRRWQELANQTRDHGRQRRGEGPFDTYFEGQPGHYGYHDLLAFLQQADQPHSEQYLYTIGEDLIAMERQHPGIWYTPAPDKGHFYDVNDLLDDTLGFLAHNNPHAATLLLDPEHNDHLEYLLLGGDTPREPPSGISVAHWQPTGLADAMEAAATGRPPGADPTTATTTPTPPKPASPSKPSGSSTTTSTASTTTAASPTCAPNSAS